MQLIGHILTFTNALLEQGYSKEETEKIVEKIAPKLLLPDTIRGLGIRREISHCSKLGKSSSWIKFPIADKLKMIESKEQLEYEYKEEELYHYSGDIMDLEIFKEKNEEIFNKENQIWGRSIVTHYQQDMRASQFWDETLLNLEIWPDIIYKLSENKKHVKWDTFYSEMYKLDEQFYIYWANIMYNKHGIKINQKWIDEHVITQLKEEYSPKIAEYPCENGLILSNEYENIGEYKFPAEVDNLDFVKEKDFYTISEQFLNEVTKASKLIIDKKDYIEKNTKKDNKNLELER